MSNPNKSNRLWPRLLPRPHPTPAPASEPNLGTIVITDLPALAQVIWQDLTPLYVTLAYRDFVIFVQKACATHAPKIHSVLDVGGEHAFVTLPAAGFRAYLASLKITGEIDESRYLEKYPDVKQAIAQNHATSARNHYLFRGYFEQREPVFQAEPGAIQCT